MLLFTSGRDWAEDLPKGDWVRVPYISGFQLLHCAYIAFAKLLDGHNFFLQYQVSVTLIIWHFFEKKRFNVLTCLK